MSERRPGLPYVFVTWLTGLLAGEAHCWWSLWFRANFSYQKLQDPTFDQLTWNATHLVMLQTRKAQLQAEGFTVRIEDQNAFRLKGKTAVVGGRQDLVAVRDDRMLVSDCKGTTHRQGKHVWQVLIYLYAERWQRAKQQTLFNPPLAGEIVYQDGRVDVPDTELTDDRVDQIQRAIRSVSGAEPARVPSEKECRFCPIADCSVRATEGVVIDVDGF